jgi:hypothetical protein
MPNKLIETMKNTAITSSSVAWVMKKYNKQVFE